MNKNTAMESKNRDAVKKAVSAISSEEFWKQMGGRYLTLDEVMKFTAMDQSAVYSMIETKEFPKPVEISPNVQAWPADEVFYWFAVIIRIASGMQEDLVAAVLCPHEKI